MKPGLDFVKSFYNKIEEGMSSRKLTAFALMLCVAYCHIRFVDASVVVEIIIIDLSFILLLLGIITVQNLIELKNGKQPLTPQNQPAGDNPTPN